MKENSFKSMEVLNGLLDQASVWDDFLYPLH